MIENTNQPQYMQNGKPVNINISFNISRKQVMQNINPIQNDQSFNLNNNIQNNINTNSKPKNNIYKPSKTPQLAQTDRHIYSKDLQFIRPTQQLKRKKKRKKSTGDYNIDKTSNFPFYTADLDKSLPNHKRGFTTTIIKKTTSNTKNKRQSTKIDQIYKQNNVTVPISAIVDQSKKIDGKSIKIQKNLKNILNKLINNELSKRSLPLPSVPSKSKYIQSTSLTSRKMSTARPTKKRSSKSHMIVKQKQFQNSNYSDSLNSDFQAFQNPKIIEKLSNFKSNQNSLLICDTDNMQDTEQCSPQQKCLANKKIVIKTDQSIQCIDQIHDWQKNHYQQFFEDNVQNNFVNAKKYKNKIQQPKSDTLLLIQTYVNLLNASDESENKIQDTYDYERLSKKSSNVNEHVQIYDGSSYLNFHDFKKVQQLLGEPKTSQNFIIPKHQNIRKQQNYQYSIEQNVNQNNLQVQELTQIQKMIQDQKQQQMIYSCTRPLWKKVSEQSENKNSQKSLNIQQNSISPKQQPSNKKSLQKQNQQDAFRPFISSEMGRQFYDKQMSSSSQRAKLNQLKKHQIQKWGNLLQYIKSNMNSQTNTQEVLEQVYEYLSKAKVDLIRQGQNINISNNEGSETKMRQRLEEQFTNKLSSQLEKSQQRNDNLIGENSKDLQSFEGINQSNDLQNSKHRLKSEQQEILDEQAKSFKSDYESEQQEQSIKFMNLSTIETALRNRFNQLANKKQKQIQKLDQSLQQRKITQQQYDQQKYVLQKQFKKQTNLILTVKKNIWKGYNEAKGILDKSYINSRVEEQFKGQLYHRFNEKSNKKDKKMMKCLSQSYLNRKKIDYKKFIEEEQRKRQEQNDHHVMKRQRGLRQSYDSDEDDDENQQKNSNEYQSQSDDDYQQGNENGSDSRGNFQSSDPSNSRLQISQYSDSNVVQATQNYAKKSIESSQNHSIQDQFEKISKKLSKLKQQHEQTLTNQKNKKQQTSFNQQKQKQIFSLNNDVNQFNINYQVKQHFQHQLNSPVLISISPQSSVHYEEIQKSIHTNSDRDSQQKSVSQNDQDYIDERDQLAEVQHSSQQQDKDQYDQDQQYSDQEQKIIAKQLSQAHQFNSTPTKSASPSLKSSLQQIKQPQIQQFKPKSTKIHNHQLSPELSQKQKKLKAEQLALQKKLKYLTEEDRQDIFQFMFLDLCIQLYQQQCHQNTLMNTINKYIAKQHELAKRKKGVKTNLNVVKDYLKRFCGYLVRTNRQVLENVNVPMGPTAIQMLKYMHENDDFQDEPIDGEDGVVTLIVPVNVFDTFQRSLLPTLQFEKYYDSQEKEQQRVNFLKNILHIHNKALFDALNQFLDQQRPFGIWGKPFPWKRSSSFTHMFTQIQQQDKLKKGAQKVVEACSYVCGLLVDKEQSLVGNAKISQGYVQQIREDRISRMLANEMIQNEQRWVFYDDEQTQVLVQTGNFIYNNLLREVMQQMFYIQKRQMSEVEVDC